MRLGKQICFTIEWGCAEILPRKMPWPKKGKRQAKTALRVQKKALQQVEGKPVVFVIESEEKGLVHLKAQPIEVGVSSQDGQWLEVISGLTEGQKYIADGSFLLKSELEKDEAGHGH